MTFNHLATLTPETRLEDLAADLTSAVYPLARRRGLANSWIKLELDLWKAVSATLRKWARQQPPAASPAAWEAWREDLLVDLTESAFHVALKNGMVGSPLEVELSLYQAFRVLVRRYGPVQKRG